MIKKLIPENTLEHALIDAQEGRIEFSQFLNELLLSELSFPSASEISPDNKTSMKPLIFEKNGGKMISIFTSPSRVKLFGDKTPYNLVVKGGGVI